MTSSSHLEVEFKLTAWDNQVLDDLATWTELAGFSLLPDVTQLIHDRYWDTDSRELSRRGGSLRLREQNGQLAFTLKRLGSTERGLFRRNELEVPATAANWSMIRGELRHDGLQLPWKSIKSEHPVDWLTAVGLRLVQDRSTERRRRRVHRQGQVLAELMLDTTTYHLGIYDIVFREVEIESIDDDAQVVLAVGLALEEAFSGRLRPSESGKFGRGLELAARLAVEVD